MQLRSGREHRVTNNCFQPGRVHIESAAQLSLVADERQLRSIRALMHCRSLQPQGLDLHEASRGLRQVFEINGTCSTDQQDLVCLALSALPPLRRGERPSNLENYLGKLGLFLVAVVRSVL
jgi:hypothetical protein